MSQPRPLSQSFFEATVVELKVRRVFCKAKSAIHFGKPEWMEPTRNKKFLCCPQDSGASFQKACVTPRTP
jgi:hypothetical protein